MTIEKQILLLVRHKHEGGGRGIRQLEKKRSFFGEVMKEGTADAVVYFYVLIWFF